MRDSGLSGRLALVTGAGGGIGAAVVRLLVEEGARVVATDLPSTALSGLAFLNGVRVEPLDVSDGAAVEALFDRIEAEDGPIDFVASVAGVLSNVTVNQTSDAEWRRVFAVNADGVFHLGRAASRRMGERGKGAFVTVSSNAAGVPRHAMAAYAASKGGVVSMTLPAARELARFGIRVMTIAPGVFETPMMAGMTQEIRDSLAAGVPFPPRLGHPAEYAALVRHIFENSMLNGEVIRLDGALRMAAK